VKVTLSRSAGFCVGVKRAIDMAIKSAEKDNNIYMLGDIVHNEFVVKLIRAKGIKKITRLGDGAGKTLLIRAHGAPLSVYTAARKAGYRIIDATCPMVKEIHRMAKKDEKNGRTVIIIGDSEHEEVSGIKGSLSKEPLIIDPAKRLPLKKIASCEKASVVVQSTQNTEKVREILQKLSKAIKDLRFHDTICVPTKNRQKDAHALPLENDAMVVIGSRASANTKRLYEISKKLNQNTFWVSSAGELNSGLLKGFKNVGLLAGASTPDEIIKEAVSFLRSV
jgi:4-hydroxy-3-methylbut-2-en-1-yl diphosphate reductase